MSDTSLRAVGLRVYWDVLQAALPQLTEIRLRSNEGGVISRFDGYSDLADDETGCAPQTDVRTFVTYPILNANDEILGALEIASGGQAVGLGRPGAAVASCIAREVMLSDELDVMARELSSRYEELNLVYHTEDQVSLFREGRDALDKLIENCRNYLDVNIAVLIMREKGVQLVHNHRRMPVPDVPFLLTCLQGPLYDWICESRQTLALNDPKDALARELGHGIPYRLLCSPILDGSNKVSGIMVTANDYSKREFSNGDKNLLSVMARKASKIIQANYDPLTGLVNRSGFEYFINSALEQAEAQNNDHVVLFMNVDSLHVINDTADYEAGDAALCAVADGIRSHLREHDVLARLGGDRFGVLIQQCSVGDGEKVAEKIREKIASLIVTAVDTNFTLSLSIGVVSLTAASENASSVIAAAEVACSVAKDNGGDNVQTYRLDNSALVQREQHIHMVGRLQTALSEDLFVLFGQPIVSLQADDASIHLEILLRMLDEEGNPCSPAQFMPAAERYFLMPEVDRWVVDNAFRQLSELPGDLPDSSRIAINISGQSFGDPDFLGFLRRQFEVTGIAPETICFEVTETAAIGNLELARAFMSNLKELGCEFSLDDFGSGLSSFSYLKNLDVDYLKIDGELVKDIVDDPTMEAMVTAINQVGHSLNLRTIAEYVENDAIRSLLTDLGVNFGQGYGIAKPEPLAPLLARLTPGRERLQA